MKDFRELDTELMRKMPNLKPKTDSIPTELAGIVFSNRIRKGLTQQQLSDKAGVDIKAIHKIEGANVGISDAIYEKVFKVLNIKN